MGTEIFLWDPTEDDLFEEFATILLEGNLNRGETKQRLKWKHTKNPFGPSIIAYARDVKSGQMIGIRPLWRTYLYTSRGKILAFQPCDTVVHPDFRRRGIFSRMTTAAVEEAHTQGADVLFNFPNKLSKPGNLQLGWSDIGGVFPLVRITRPLRVGRYLLSTRGAVGRFEQKQIDHQKAGSMAMEVELPSPQKRLHPEHVCGLRSKEYFKWRFANHPVYTYRVIDTSSFTLVVRTGWRGNLRELSVVEVLPKNEMGCEEALLKLLEVGRSEVEPKPDIITVLLTKHHRCFEVFTKNRFLKLGKRVNFVARSLTNDFDLKKLRWSLTGADVDTF